MATRGGKTNDLFTALGHPLRRRILRRMLEEDRLISPLELSTGLDEPLSALSYHVRVLAECKAAKLVSTKKIRGSTQHFYRATVGAEWAHAALRATKDPPARGKRRGEENG